MKYVILIKAMVQFEVEPGDFSVNNYGMTKEVKVRAAETNSYRMAMDIGGALQDLQITSQSSMADRLLECAPALRFHRGNNAFIRNISEWSAQVMKEKKVTRKKLVLAD